MLRTSVVFQILVLLGIWSLPSICLSAIQLPRDLSRSDREEALRIVGFGTSSKILTDPYPLGGYSGFEVGISVENIPADELGRLGAKLAQPQPDAAVAKFTIGKGLYNDIDAFFQFTPYNRQNELSQFGVIVRWGFYQADFLPLSASILGHFNAGNISNQMSTRTNGIDSIVGINVENVSVFAGGGWLEARGTFVGGDSGITDTGELSTESVDGFHSVVGANVHLGPAFLAFQIDRSSISVFSGKLGVRF